jgi:hypothetical protein
MMMPMPHPQHRHPHHGVVLPHTTMPAHPHATPSHPPQPWSTGKAEMHPNGSSHLHGTGPHGHSGTTFGQPVDGGASLPKPSVNRRPPPPPVRMSQPRIEEIPRSQPRSEGGSLFETLSDPFTDDEASVKVNRPIRPSSHNELVPVPVENTVKLRPLSRSVQSSSRRRASSSR